MNENIQNFGPKELVCEYAQWYDIEEFAQLVVDGVIKDSEGFGYYANDEKISSVRVVPEEFIEDAENIKNGITEHKGVRDRMDNGKYVVWHPNE